MASIFPPAENGEQATTEEDCLAKLLLSRIEPEKRAEDGEQQQAATGAPAPATEGAKKDEGSEVHDPERESAGADGAKEDAVTEGVPASNSQQLVTALS